MRGLARYGTPDGNLEDAGCSLANGIRRSMEGSTPLVSGNSCPWLCDEVRIGALARDVLQDRLQACLRWKRRKLPWMLRSGRVYP